MKRYTVRGFTLVELLIVIALLGVIATIVIAAINPIEQANRASDAGLKSDSSQIVSAIQRYYATHDVFPWNTAACGTNGGTQCLYGGTHSVDDAFPFLRADDPSAGICGAVPASCKTSAVMGELIAALELQKTFLNKSWINASSNQYRLWVGKAQGASSGVFVCWSPKSNSNRQVLIASKTTSNKLYDATQAFTSSGLPAAGACSTVNDTAWTTGACVECVPE